MSETSESAFASVTRPSYSPALELTPTQMFCSFLAAISAEIWPIKKSENLKI